MAAPSTSTGRTNYQTFPSRETTSTTQTVRWTIFRALSSAMYSCCSDIAACFSRRTGRISINDRRIYLERLIEAAYAPIDNQAIKNEHKAFCEFVNTTVKAAAVEQQDLEGTLQEYIGKRLMLAEKENKSIIFKIQIICTFAEVLQKNKNIKESQPLLTRLRSEYQALIFKLQTQSQIQSQIESEIKIIDIHDNIDHSGMMPRQKVEELQTMFEESMRHYIISDSRYSLIKAGFKRLSHQAFIQAVRYRTESSARKQASSEHRLNRATNISTMLYQLPSALD